MIDSSCFPGGMAFIRKTSLSEWSDFNLQKYLYTLQNPIRQQSISPNLPFVHLHPQSRNHRNNKIIGTVNNSLNQNDWLKSVP